MVVSPLKKIAIVFLLIFIFTGGIFFWQKNQPSNSMTSSSLFPTKIFMNNTEKSDKESSQASTIEADKQIVSGNTKIIVNPENNQEEIKVTIPKGKRLYDEEKMKEISTDANVDILSR